MLNKDDILWFKQQFHTKIAAVVHNTPFSLDMITAIACQETGELWPILCKRPLGLSRVLELCVGDTIDASGGRKGTTADELRAELAAIIEWLAVDKETYLRCQPCAKLTFCNIYTYDYCHLAGVYLPRVWWTPGAIETLTQGQSVQPLYGKTIDEQRANDLFRWLRDFGPRFSWRQTGTLSKLQLEVNQGAIGLIVARRKEDGLSGHIVAVMPETEEHRARRNTVGERIAPLQSQAGATNFRYSTGKLDWWKDERFAESALWLHA